MSDMRRVSQSAPCIICKKPTWCLSGRSVVICMRVESSRKKTFKGGEVGYIHYYPDGKSERPAYRPPPKARPVINTRKVLDAWKRAFPNSRLPMLAHELGVSIWSLEELEFQLAGGYNNAWALPMKDGYGNYIGIRIRNLLAQKWAVTGSQAGLFIPLVKPTPRMFLVEGPTDTAAGLTLGLYAVGRPSCSGGVPHIVDHVRKQRIQEVVIIADNDTPGIKGATDLQPWLPVPSCVLLLPTKDLRGFLHLGGDKSTIDSMIEQLVWTQPKESK